jgi:hypothetical protein
MPICGLGYKSGCPGIVAPKTTAEGFGLTTEVGMDSVHVCAELLIGVVQEPGFEGSRPCT